MICLVLLTMAIIWLLPKITSAVPASLVAIATVTLLSIGVNLSANNNSGHDAVAVNPIATVGDMLRTNATAAATGAGAHSHSSESQLASSLKPGEAIVVASSAEEAASKFAEAKFAAAKIPEADTATQGNIAHAVVDGSGEQASAGISGGLPQLFFLQYEMVPMNWSTFKIIFPFAIILLSLIHI